jgi:hypothetical protein
MTDSLADELVRTVGMAAADLRTLDDTAAIAKQKPDAWSIKEIVGHLIDSAANNHQRLVRAQQGSELVFLATKRLRGCDRKIIRVGLDGAGRFLGPLQPAPGACHPENP